MAALLAVGLVLTGCVMPTPVALEGPAPAPAQMSAPAVAPLSAPSVEAIAVAPEAGGQLEETLWVLVAFGDALNPVVVEPGTVVSAWFSEDGVVSGSGGCNRYSADYATIGDALSVGPIAGTQMFCDAGMDQEAAYFDALQAATAYKITAAGQLEIAYSSGVVYDEKMIFMPGQQPLAGTPWVLQSFGHPDEPLATEADTLITAVFVPAGATDAGTVTGLAGCNQYSASYIAQDGEISIGAAAVTRESCPQGMAQEDAYLAALESAESYRTVGNVLEIVYDEGEGLLTFATGNLPLQEVLWSLTAVDGEPLPEAAISALFGPLDDEGVGPMGGSAGCNSYSATYEMTGDAIAIGPALTSRKFCEGLMEAEDLYLTALEEVDSYRIVADRLQLQGEGRVLDFVADRLPLEDTHWRLVSVGAIDDPQPPWAGTDFTARFLRQWDAPSGTVSGSTGCNDYSAAYTADFSTLKVNLPQTTQQFCGDGVAEQEQQFFLGLNSARHYRIVGDYLQIIYDEGRQALNFVAVPAAVLSPLDGTAWILVSMAGETLVRGTEITAAFDVDEGGLTGTVSGSAGCNNYSADIEEGFRVGPAAATAKMCQWPSGIMDQEQAYLSMLQTASGYEVDGDQLSLTTESGPLVYVRAPGAVAQPPEAVIRARSEAYVGQVVTFDGSASRSQSAIVSYRWDFGDGGRSSAPRTGHAFSRPGTYRVSLTVVNAAGLSDTATMRVTVYTYQTPPTAIISGPSQGYVGQPVTFRSQSRPGSSPIVGYAWDLGTRSATTRTAAEVSVTATYSRPGTYTVSLTVTDRNGLRDSTTHRIVIREAPTAVPPTAIIAGPTEAYTGQPVTFRSQSRPGSSPIVSYAWDLGAPSASTQSSADVSVTTTYSQPGTYQVRLTVTDANGLRDSTTHRIVIRQTPTQTPPTAIIAGPTEGVAGQPVTFRSQSRPGSSPIVGYAWDLGGPAPSAQGATDVSVTTTYSQPGTYRVRLTVTDANGLRDSDDHWITIRPAPVQNPPTAAIEGPSQAYVGEPVTFVSRSRPGSSPIVSYAWDLGTVATPAQSTTDVRVTTVYNQPGTYRVRLTVTDANGLSDSTSREIRIVQAPVQTGPTAAIEGPSQAFVGDEVTFVSRSQPGSSPIVSYAWDLGAPGITPYSPPDVRVTTAYDQPGIYTVRLTVTDANGLSDRATHQITIQERPQPQQPPRAAIEGPASAAVGQQVTFTSRSQPGSSPIVAYAWNLGGQASAAATGTDVSVTTSYSAAGAYQVSLTVTDANGLSDTATQQIDIFAALQGTTWLWGNALPGTEVSLRFSGGTVSGFTGCNDYNGAYTGGSGGSSGSLSISNLVSTPMACAPEVMQQESEYLSALAGVGSYAIQGTALSLNGAGGTLTFYDQSGPQPR